MKVALVAAAAGLLAANAGAAVRTKTFTLYARATQVQYLNHADDRQRGLYGNPFNVDAKSLPTPAKKGSGSAPGPGDNALFSFKIYKDAALKQKIGTAVYSCTFNFSEIAICDASYELNGGTMTGGGPIDFRKTSFTLAVSGGTGTYFGARGQVSSAPAVKNVHRLDFVLR